jgi:dCMP deaminase
MLSKWDIHFIKEAEHWATLSKDPNTKIGGVLVNNKQVISTGYNGIPRGVNDNVSERNSRIDGEKYYWYEHCERNTIYNAARVGMKTIGSTLYLSCGVPCADCARAIVQAGITKIYCNINCKTNNTDKWKKSSERSKIMFIEANVDIIYYNCSQKQEKYNALS